MAEFKEQIDALMEAESAELVDEKVSSLADKIGVTRMTIYRWRRGIMPTSQLVLRAVEALYRGLPEGE